MRQKRKTQYFAEQALPRITDSQNKICVINSWVCPETKKGNYLTKLKVSKLEEIIEIVTWG